jgi:hypothetical protein
MFDWWPSWDQWETIGKVAPIATAVIALGAAGTAVAAILIQRDIAKRRAAIDFFLKTDLDREIISLYDRFKKLMSRSYDLLPCRQNWTCQNTEMRERSSTSATSRRKQRRLLRERFEGVLGRRIAERI